MSAPESATGLVLRTRPLTETSLIVHWLTREFGRVATVAKGARRPKSAFFGKVDLFFLDELSFVRSRRSELHALREVRLLEAHAPIRTNIGYLRQCAYCANLVEQATESDTPLTEVFELMRGLLEVLPRSPPRPHAILAFELRLLSLLGLAPDLQSTRLGDHDVSLMRLLTGSDWSTIVALGEDTGNPTKLRQFLHGYLIYHLGRLARGREIAVSSDPAS